MSLVFEAPLKTLIKKEIIMRDILGWDCYDGCDCKEKGNIHHNEIRPQQIKPKHWWNIF